LEESTHGSISTLRATQTFDSKDQSETSHGPENDEKLPLSFINISYGGIDFACQDQDISFDSTCNLSCSSVWVLSVIVQSTGMELPRDESSLYQVATVVK